MASENRSKRDLERIVEVHESPESTGTTAPSTTRALAASGVTVVVVAAIILGAPVLAVGLLLAALAVAVATAGDTVPGAVRATVRSLAIEERLAECRAWLANVWTRVASLPERAG